MGQSGTSVDELCARSGCEPAWQSQRIKASRGLERFATTGATADDSRLPNASRQCSATTRNSESRCISEACRATAISHPRALSKGVGLRH